MRITKTSAIGSAASWAKAIPEYGRNNTVKHPGPWKLDADQIVDSRPEDGTADGVVVYRVRGIGDEDLRLILAAPELLAALEAIVKSLDESGGQDCPLDVVDTIRASEVIIGRIKKGSP